MAMKTDRINAEQQYNKILEGLKNLDFEGLKEKYSDLFTRIYEDCLSWTNNRDKKINEMGLIINHIKDLSYSFTEKDIVEIEDFTKNINYHIKLNQFINNIKDSTINKKMNKRLFELFNELKRASTIDELSSINVKINGNNIIRELFSVVKFIQKPNEYLLNYKLWRHLCNEVFSISVDDYDSLCEFYRKLPHERKPADLSMFVYMDCIASIIAQEISELGIKDSLKKTTVINPISSFFEDKKIDYSIEENIGILSEKNEDVIVCGSEESDKPLNLILYGPPGTGKTYSTVDKALERIGIDINSNEYKNNREAKLKKFRELKKEGRIVFTTFHQSMSYEDFVEGIKPITNGKDVTYDVKPGIFKQICEKASTAAIKTIDQALTEFIKDVDRKGSTGYDVPYYKSGGHFTIFTNQNANSFKVTNIKSNSTATQSATFGNIKEYYSNRSESKNTYVKCIVELLEQNYLKCLDKKSYVLIIDEINRGNVSQIFGELITLIEEDKRLGNKEELTVKLPYSSTCKKETEDAKKEGEEFGVPNNLYIIGTMNTADRSVEALDTALRRRFSFEEMMPKYDATGMDRVMCGLKLCDILWTINQRIEVLKGREQQIGHSYLMKCKDEDDLKRAFKDKIVPLLQEYFYGDYSQIGLVLGAGFVKKVIISDIRFPKGFESPSLNEVYHLLTDEDWVKLKMVDALQQMGVQSWSNSSAENTSQARDPQNEQEETKTEDSQVEQPENLS